MSNNIVNEYSTTIITIFQNVIKNYENNLDVIKQTEEELTDIEHEIELSAAKDMYKGYLLYKEIRELRLKRRCAKDENQLLKDMYDFLNTQQGQSFKNKIQQIQGAAAKIVKKQESRTYTPRRRSDLTVTDKTCEVVKPFEELMNEFKKVKVEVKKGKLRK